MTSDEYADIFGFTQQEVFSAMDEMGLTDKQDVETWYDGYVIGDVGGFTIHGRLLTIYTRGK